ncbi:translation initiation factor IF-2-like [Myotis myotis]|uniref:translation initiation factor IF-2-like n=1 Tax=Myotis myotis TaxID=51298 RepID=UPI00174A3A19|nr:translation initiation factor IF-2-like [Myotis myotis]
MGYTGGRVPAFGASLLTSLRSAKAPTPPGPPLPRLPATSLLSFSRRAATQPAPEARQPPRQPEPRAFRCCPVTRASHRREARGRLLAPTLTVPPKSPVPLTSAARQPGVFLCSSGSQLGGPRTLLPITQSPPQATAGLTNQRLSPARRRAPGSQRKARVPPHAPAAAARSHCSI